MTTGTFPRSLARPFGTVLSRRSMAAGFLVTLSAGLGLLAAIAVALAISTGAVALQGVSVGGISLAGLDRAAAQERLLAELPSVSDGSALVRVGEQQLEIPYADLGRRYDLDAMLDSAFGVGRSAGPVANAIARLRAPLHETQLPVVIHQFDPASLADAAAHIAASTSRAPVSAAVSRSGTELTVHPAADGWLLEASAVESALSEALAGAGPADVAISLEATSRPPAVSTADAAAVAEAAQSLIADLPLRIPGAGSDEERPVLAASQIATWLRFGLDQSGRYGFALDQQALMAAVAGLRDDIDRDPADAGFTVAAGGGLAGVKPGQDGRQLQVPQAIASVRRALAQRAEGSLVGAVTLPVALTAPGLSTEEAEAALPQMRLVSSWTTYYTAGDGNGFGNNISIGAWDLDGYTIAPGEWFSFWDGIGPVTVERGYRYGGAIINGRSVANGALAGGICSTSTTLFNAAMRFGLEIGERENHFYYIPRYPTGLDATVAIVGTDVTDMTFRNDTDAPVVIRGYGTPGVVTFQIWSIPNGRKVVLSQPTITNYRTAGDVTQLDPSMAAGTARRVEYPHHGFDVSVTRWVYDANGALIHHNNWFSDYRAVDGVTLVGPAPAAPPPDEEEGGD